MGYKLVPIHKGAPEIEKSHAEIIIKTYKDGMLNTDDKNSFQNGYQMCLIDFGYKIVKK
ncbi:MULTISPECIES: hypothetical protein [Bacillus amyloliquefaciens group]|uniref:hypothetical protein n=1 Tax=Bacillus amyloliquefaciens group TaxID=1938374 RepID=UPI00226D8A8B|nr:hypothetical protein [Bacillus velezensis]MCY0092188.1 hypothetical protein [Bacillus velezensis]